VSGFDACESTGNLDDARFRSNTGSLPSRVTCSMGDFRLDRPLTLTWQLSYDARSAPR